jgi:hypothetical protein
MRILGALLSIFLVGCASNSTTRVHDLLSRPAIEVATHLAYEMPEYPPHPDPAQARTVVVTPTIAVPAFGGHILGAHRGEWGGELAFRHPDGSTEVFLHEPVQAIENVAGRYLAFVGLAHLSANSGAIYHVSSDNSGRIHVDFMVRLAGAPIYVARVTKGVVFVVASGRFERKSLVATPIFDCYFLDEHFRIMPTSCARVRAGR